MALNYSSVMLGTLTIKQPKRGDNGEYIKDSKGNVKYNKYNVHIRQGNALAIFIYPYKNKGKWFHQLYAFFNDETHIKNILAGNDGKLFDDEVDKIELNLYHKECKTLLKYMVRSGLRVECYYKEDKK